MAVWLAALQVVTATIQLAAATTSLVVMYGTRRGPDRVSTTLETR
jgi:hypothetical protein